MPGLLDIARLSEVVAVNGVDVEVFGVSARGVARLLSEFEEIRSLFSGREIEPSKLMALGPDVVAEIIAAGTGSPGDAATIAAADALPVDVQLEMITAILRLTMPKGLALFMERLTALGGLVNDAGSAGASSAKALAPKSPKQSSSS